MGLQRQSIAGHRVQMLNYYRTRDISAKERQTKRVHNTAGRQHQYGMDIVSFFFLMIIPLWSTQI